ncbi:MAG TPA: right-handed parallel beta-helix repeat-containing protein [Flavitalea sp.]|nr:right-handed parallel beta-helix repeat-containing protein [Flavitalea sp.]
MKKIFYALLFISPVCFAQENLGDALVTPKRPKKIIHVGGPGADIQGFTNHSIQIAVEALPPEGGIVKMDTGVYTMMAPVRLKSNVQLIGSGPRTVLRRIDGFHSRFIIDADYGELKITVEDASKFKPGMSIQVTNKPYSDCWDVSTAVITDIVKDTLFFDTHLIRDYEAGLNGMVTNAGSCVSVYGVQNVLLSDFQVDGNKTKNDLLDGCNGGGVAIIKSNNVTVDHVVVKDFNGEGITWQITNHVTIRNSEINGCTNMGLHPGTGSPNTVIENNFSHNNKVGLYICWRVQNSIVRNNVFSDNSTNGISTGHKDSDVLFEGNTINGNGEHGVYIRDENIKNSPCRNTFTDNKIEDNKGYGIYIAAEAPDLVLKNNTIRNTQSNLQKAAIYVAQKGIGFTQNNNKMTGHADGNILYGKN